MQPIKKILVTGLINIVLTIVLFLGVEGFSSVVIVAKETFFSDYKRVGDIWLAHKYTVRRDGKPFVESEATQVKPADKLDDKLFARP